MWSIGHCSCDVFVTGGEANRAAMAAGVRRGGGGAYLAWSAHPLSGFSSVGVDIVSWEGCGPEIGLWGPWYEDPGSLEEMPDLFNVGDSE